MFNRFLIDNSLLGLSSAQGVLPLDHFLQVWLSLMTRVSTRNAMMFNLLALLPLLEHLPLPSLLPLQQPLLAVLAQVEKVCVQTDPLIVTSTANSRLCEYKLSVRKETLRKRFMYQHIHLPSHFKTHFQAFLQSLGSQGHSLSLFSDQATLQRLIQNAQMM